MPHPLTWKLAVATGAICRPGDVDAIEDVASYAHANV
jgi:hypothetical protein